jgi:hypothetical protein
MKHFTYWGIKNIRCHCAKWSHLGSSVLVTNWNCQKCRKMSPFYQCRQQLINCGCVVFHRSQPTAGGRNKPFLVAVLGLKGWRTIICLWYYGAGYVACLSSYCTHVTWHKGTLKVCLIGVQLTTSTCLFLQWHFVTFPQKLGGGTYGDRSGPLQNIHPVSKGWICVEGTEDCLVLKNHLHRLIKGDMLWSLAFWRVGESQTLYKKSVLWEWCVPDLNLLPWNINSSHNRTRACFFSFHNRCMWV